MLITLTPGGTGRREEVAPQIQEVAPTDSRGGPHYVYGVALCSMWHFALCEKWIQEVAPHIQEAAPTTCMVWHFASCGTLFCVRKWIQEVAPQIQEVAATNSRGAPHHVYGVALLSVWHLVPFRICQTLGWSWDTSSSSRHQACSIGRRYNCAINKSNSAGDRGTWDTGV